tara:strand:- start:288 stop:506 length:219 start_codon:yes stop_codon:yes gene_type:complete
MDREKILSEGFFDTLKKLFNRPKFTKTEKKLMKDPEFKKALNDFNTQHDKVMDMIARRKEADRKEEKKRSKK